MILQIEQAYANNAGWARDQAICNASLAAMLLMLAAKAMGLDSCPMGGFDPNQLVKAFAIPDRYWQGSRAGPPVCQAADRKYCKKACRPSSLSELCLQAKLSTTSNLQTRVCRVLTSPARVFSRAPPPEKHSANHTPSAFGTREDQTPAQRPKCDRKYRTAPLHMPPISHR